MVVQETLRVLHLIKSINGEPVLDDISFHVDRGEIVGIIGLQNTGKSLLTDILSGSVSADSGLIFLNDEPVSFSSIAQAQEAGIFCLSAQPQLVPGMSVALNLFLLNSRNRNRHVFSPRKIRAEAAAILERFHLDIRPSMLAENLPPLEARLLELVCVAVQRPKLVILNNIPLSEDNVRDSRMLRIILQMQREGVSFLFMGNKVSKATLMSSRIHLMKNGILTSGIPSRDLDEDTLFRFLTGISRSALPQSLIRDHEGQSKKELLCVKDAEFYPQRTLFRLYEGEILGVVLDEMPYDDPDYVFSFLGGSQGRRHVYKNGLPVRWNNVKRILRSGAVLIPDLGQGGGLFPDLSAIDNLTLAIQRSLSGPLGWINRRKCRYAAEQSAALLGIEPEAISRYLSAETEKKIWIGRWLWKQPDIYIFLNPFTALDESGFEEIRHTMEKLTQRGAGILIISSDYNKIHDISTRVLEF